MQPDSELYQGNRAQRRIAARSVRNNKQVLAGLETVRPKKSSFLLDNEDDLPLYRSEWELSKKLETQLQLSLRIYRIYRQVGVSDETYRKHLISSLPGQDLYDPAAVQTSMIAEVHPGKLKPHLSQIQMIRGQFIRLGIKADPSKETIEEAILLLSDPDIRIEDLFQEGLRSRRENNELLQMQIGWLEGKKREVKEEPKTAFQPKVTEPDTAESISPPEQSENAATYPTESSPVTIAEDNFALSGWNLYWANTHWSTEPQHLVPIPTQSRIAALEALDPVLRGEIMIPSRSVLNALEFYLSKDVIQKALATRLKYGPEERRGWIKIKRGRGRILLLTPSDNQAIFFAGNRDSIYR